MNITEPIDAQIENTTQVSQQLTYGNEQVQVHFVQSVSSLAPSERPGYILQWHEMIILVNPGDPLDDGWYG